MFILYRFDLPKPTLPPGLYMQVVCVFGWLIYINQSPYGDRTVSYLTYGQDRRQWRIAEDVYSGMTISI